MSFGEYVNSKFSRLLDFLTKLILVNILWFLATVAGLVVFTAVPAIIAMYTIIHHDITGQDLPIFSSFFAAFKGVYWKGQRLFLSYLVIGAIISVDVYYFYQSFGVEQSWFHALGLTVSIILALLYLFSLVHIGPVVVHFPGLTTFQTLKYSFLLSVGYLFHTLLIIMVAGFSLTPILLYPHLVTLIPTLLVALNVYFALYVLRGKYLRLTGNVQK